MYFTSNVRMSVGSLCLIVFANIIATNPANARWSIDAPNSGRKASGSRLIRSYPMTEQVKASIIRAHNNGRSNVVPPPANMRKMSWNDDLATEASKLANKCVFSASMTNDLKRFRRVEENVFISDSHEYNAQFVTTAAQKWLAEKVNYNYNTRRCTTGKQCNHYRQMVWAETFLVGCAVTECSAAMVKGARWSDVTMMVCSYGPGGNWITSQPYKTGVICSGCHATDTCVNKLCTNPSRDVSPPKPAWSQWTEWTPCSLTCGFGGSRSRTRYCNTFINTDCGGVSRKSEFLCSRNVCNVKLPTTPVGRWNRWGSWSACTKTCGGGSRSRSRTCSTGKVSDCTGSASTSIMCNARPCPKWNNWRSWESCSASCGGGSRVRTRACSTGSNADCTGDASESGSCNQDSCPARVSKYTQWTTWSGCSKTCGSGVETRTRTCRSVCLGRLRDTRPCTLSSCPSQRRAWSAWGSWSKCTKTCGIGIKSRSRQCQGTVGPSCTGIGTGRVACNTQKCAPVVKPQPVAVAASWRSWEDWSECTKSCGGGIRFRIRQCSADDNKECCGLSHSTSPCNAHACPAAAWTPWGEWKNVGDSCLADTQMRKRSCSGGNPQDCCTKN